MSVFSQRKFLSLSRWKFGLLTFTPTTSTMQGSIMIKRRKGIELQPLCFGLLILWHKPYEWQRGKKKKSFLSPNYSSSSTWKTFPNPNIIEIGCVLINWHFLRKFQLQNEHLALLFGSLLEIYVVGQDWLLFSWLLTMNETLNYYIFPWGGRNNGITVSLVFKPFPLFRIF